ncbi:hypothetical protein FisN_3Hh104 [Fistulifera solaris]|jgi:hemoglobin|uniref:Globin family profile domain-containing protein n=1 Tax=Fistulifera solaris TaxID=1519565 RepID=A0A1Z5JP70_FISSO|nr:hypothetical protein FisN_3Hh104 [Fistulifera solaris]|eukprot:GAX15632.1 hypothetical protein FisN_3Hh104 [Fistulifera solaris]
MTLASAEVLHSSQSSRKDELLAKLGGKQVLNAAVDRFYDRLLQDPELQRFFHGNNISVLKWHQFNFMSIAFTTMPKDLDVEHLVLNKHAKLFEMGLNESHFDLMMKHLRSTFEELDIDKALIQEAVQVLTPMRSLFEQGGKAANLREENWRKGAQAAAAVAVISLLTWRFMATRKR